VVVTTRRSRIGLTVAALLVVAVRYGPALLPVAVAGALVLSLVAASVYAPLRRALSTRRR
jgi:hypothetical protein